MRTVDALPQHVDALIYRMPRAQRERLLATHGPGVASKLRANMRDSVLTWCGLDDDGPVTIGGLIPTNDPSLGYVWQLITPDVAKHKRDYIKQGRELARRMFQHFPRVGTIIETEYAAAIKHTKRYGAAVYPVPPDAASFPSVYCEVTKNV